jgi:dTDP-glucose 4,6-dehydratase
MTNVVGTFTLSRSPPLLDPPRRTSARHLSLPARFLGRIFGSLGPDGRFSRMIRRRRIRRRGSSRSPGAGVARTFGLPTVVSISSNNFGPYQFPETDSPHDPQRARMPAPPRIRRRQSGATGSVDDRATSVDSRTRPAWRHVLAGGFGEHRNIDVVRAICRLLDELAPDGCHGPRDELIELVTDRPGHDLRYAIDPSRLVSTLG